MWSRAGTALPRVSQGHPAPAGRVTGAGPGQRQGLGRSPLHRCRRDGDGPGGEPGQWERISVLGLSDSQANGNYSLPIY